MNEIIYKEGEEAVSSNVVVRTQAMLVVKGSGGNGTRI